MKNKGFTLIELVIVIAVIVVLYGIILFSVTQYINKGKDSNIAGSLAILIPAGEVFYNSNGNSYAGFCDPTQSTGTVFKNTISQMPQNFNGDCYSNATDYNPTTNPQGVCCYIKSTNDAWVAYAKEFANSSNIYCVDSRGMKENTPSSSIAQIISTFQCP